MGKSLLFNTGKLEVRTPVIGTVNQVIQDHFAVDAPRLPAVRAQDRRWKAIAMEMVVGEGNVRRAAQMPANPHSQEALRDGPGSSFRIASSRCSGCYKDSGFRRADQTVRATVKNCQSGPHSSQLSPSCAVSFSERCGNGWPGENYGQDGATGDSGSCVRANSFGIHIRAGWLA